VCKCLEVSFHHIWEHNKKKAPHHDV
jgi:hypothetical protein